MRTQTIAAAVLAAGLATPAFAGPVQTFGDWMLRAGHAQRHFFATNASAPLSPHCRWVLAHPQKSGVKEVKWCRSLK
jgi:hypothetical protein